jgi:hypothetical protein
MVTDGERVFYGIVILAGVLALAVSLLAQRGALPRGSRAAWVVAWLGCVAGIIGALFGAWPGVAAGLGLVLMSWPAMRPVLAARA